MKTLLKYIQPIIIVVLLFLLWTKGCKGETKTVYVEVPAKHGQFDTVKEPKPIVRVQKEYVYLAGKDKTDTVKVENPINTDLWNYYVANEAKKDSLYADAIGEREYNIKQEDSLLITENYIKTQGKVLAFQQSYTIKPQKIAVKDKETFLRLLGGVELGNTKELNDFTAKGSITLQNSKGNIFSVGYDTEQRVYVGYGFSIFNWRK